MKKIIILLLSAFCFYNLNAQETEKKNFTPGGKAFAKVYWNYNYVMSGDVNQTSAFEIQRSYFGYKHAFSEDISTKITFDVGNNSSGSGYTAFLKHAQLDWKLASTVKLTVGLIGLKQFGYQENFWGYRYIYKSYQDEYGFGSSADVGFNVEVKPYDKVKMNVFVLNGGGYKKLQDDFGMHRMGANVIAQPIENLTLKVYYDIMPGKYDVFGNDSIIADTASISNLSFFAGYDVGKFRIGIEYNMLNNGTKYTDAAEDHNLSGLSIYTTYVINKKYEVFGRFDQLSSNKLSGTSYNWNNSKDGNTILIGLQFAPVKGVKTALNYRRLMLTNSSKYNLMYINFEYKF